MAKRIAHLPKEVEAVKVVEEVVEAEVEMEKVESEDCGCPEGAEDECVSVVCPRQ